MNLFAFILIFILFPNQLLCNDRHTIGVPLLIWSNYGLMKYPSQSSSLDQFSSQKFRDDILMYAKNSNSTLITFVQNKLSLEDFSTANGEELQTLSGIFKSFPSYFIVNVENPIETIEMNFNVTEIKAFNGDDDDGNGISINTDTKSILIELPSDDLKDNDKIIGKLLNKIHGNSIMIFTSRQNSYTDDEIHRISRHILQKRENPKIDYNNNLLNFSDCIFLYTNGGTVNLNRLKINEKPESVFRSKLPPKPEKFDGRCALTEAGSIVASAMLELKYEFKDNEKLELSFDIDISNRKKWWNVKSLNGIITLKDSKTHNFSLGSNEIESSGEFSFSCSKLIVKNRINQSSDDTMQLIMEWKRFQLQPFKSRNLRKVFSESFDCATFFTIPIWMGFATILMFVVIISFGVYLLMEIRTMDRFENPKGKTITVPAGE